MKISLGILAVFTSVLSYSQQAANTPATVQINQAQSTSIQQQNLYNSNNLTISSTTISGALIGSQISSTGAHTCSSFELTQQHYQDRGLLNEFNQSSLDGAMNVEPVAIDKTPGANNISVIFHVVYNPANPSGNVSNALIMQVFNDLTDDYQLLNADAANARAAFGFVPADANINFCLATQDPSGSPLAEIGVTRVSTTEDWYDSGNGEENKMKSSATGGSQIWDRNNYLNVWICDISNGASSGTAGYAYRPTPTLLPSSSIDGIVLDYNLGINNDNVLTHEVGHYLGLDHTWGGSGSCSSDDGFADTPNTLGPSFDYPGSCSGSQQTCGATETQYENYMDYANCTVMFTQNQADYMLTILQGIRSSLLISIGCNPTNTPPISQFTSSPVAPAIIPVNGGVNFIDQSTNVPTGWNWTISGIEGADWNWIGGTTANSQDPQAEFYSVGFYDVTLAASNAYGTDATPAISLNHVQVVAAAAGTVCDTLRNWDPADVAANNFTYYNVNATNGAWGQIPAHNNIDLYGDGSSVEETWQYVEQYTYAGTAEVRRIRMPIFTAADMSGTGTVDFKVYADDAGGVPGTVLATETVNIADINAGAWNEFDFTTPASVTGTFWVGFELFYGSPQDTILVGMSGVTIAGGVDGYQMEMSAYGWLNSTLLGVTGSMAIDVMLSNGPAPSSTFTATDNTVCPGGSIDVNGSGSTNVTDYFWYVTDDPFTTTIQSSVTPTNSFNFPNTGAYSIYLFGDGSCMTDGVVLSVTVNPPVTAIAVGTNTTCGNNNGTITISGETGGDGTYFYSLDGANYYTSNVFSNLADGTYTVYVATVGDQCETTYSVTINPSTPFVAGVSANSSICPGGNTNITASGGTSYQWFDGATLISSSAMTNVTPTVTTQYTCLVTDAASCQSTVTTTITVNPTPAVPIITASGPTTICAGSNVDLTSSYATNNVWSTTETSSTINVSSTNSYTVTYTDGNGCTSISAATSITVNTAPVITSGTITSPSSCASSTGSIQVTGTGTGNISWTGTTSGNANGITLPYVIPSLAAGSYNITFTDGTGCNSNLLAQGLNDPTPPTIPTITAGGLTTFCTGGSVVLTSSYTGGNTWTTAETTDAITVSTSTTISVTYTDGSGCSATSAPVIVTLNNNPTAPTITAGGPTTFCAGGSVTLTSSQGTGNNWSNGDLTQNTIASTNGPYTVTYTDGNGCSATSSSTMVTVNPLPSVTFTALSDLCNYNNPITLTEGSPMGGVYTGTGVTADSFDPSAAGNGTHTLTYTYTDGNGCSDVATSDIMVDGCLAIEENKNTGLKIYPNPTSNELFIELEGNFEVLITDSKGKIVSEINGSNSLSINTSKYSAGVYMVRISTNSFTTTERIVKN